METNPNTVFHSLHKLTSPTAHLAVFRGDQDSIHLLTDAYMSPFLHNSSDTYHRHLSRQLQHGLELYQGMHNRQWIHDTKGRRAFLRLTNHLENFTQPFVHGFQRERRRQDAERKLYGETGEEFRKREFVRKEEVGMSRCGWGVEDLDKIKKVRSLVFFLVIQYCFSLPLRLCQKSVVPLESQSFRFYERLALPPETLSRTRHSS